ncbi:SDR family oxidoreductase [Cyanobium sp. PCC 7001]|uniref:non-ribosomal peptide synthetase n=1 Tax=Cyanobium sp. PCC 7001 TaxID=180281 RepID=UPI0012E9DD6F|nr:SDR family oxidoreductase [Cyanobium sp. PCC 7001]
MGWAVMDPNEQSPVRDGLQPSGEFCTPNNLSASDSARPVNESSADQSSGNVSEGWPDASVTARALQAHLRYEQIIDAILSGYAERPALAERSYLVRPDPSTGQTVRVHEQAFRSISYRTLQERVHALTMAWRLHPDSPVQAGAFVVLVGFASIDYAVLDLALAYTKGVPVPLSPNHSSEDDDAILGTVQPVTLAVSISEFSGCVDLIARSTSIRTVIVFDLDPAVDCERAALESGIRALNEKGSDVVVQTLQDLIDVGRDAEFSFLPIQAQDQDDLALLIHTSGSTGTPKGACISSRALINTWRHVSGPYPKVTVVLAPFHHMMGRDSMITALGAGGTAYFTLRPDLSTVIEDIRLARPTGLVLFPRLCEVIEHHLTTAPEYSGNEILGGRLQSIVVASAPITPRLKASLECLLGVPVSEGYSSTETASGGLAMNGLLNRNNILAYRLRDVPEAGYSVNDRPFPRGELCVKTRFGISGYFRNPEATAELFDDDGFYCTGDIVEERAPDQIAIIDRRKNVIKLAQGEYVAVGRLEQLFQEGCGCVQQIHLHGDSTRAYLLAVVVPDRNTLAPPGSRQASEAELKARVREEILTLANQRELRGFEIPRDLILAEEPFSQQNGLLSSLGKPIRPAIRARYRSRLESLYASHEATRGTELEAIRASAGAVDVETTLLALLSSTLGVVCGAADRQTSFRELGGDSLAAVQLAMEIKKQFGVGLEGSQILGPGGTVEAWARRIHTASIQQAPHQRVGSPLAAIPAEGWLKPDHYRLENLIGIPIGTPSAEVARPTGGPPTVLLTGATGFLGGRLCLEWLQRLAGQGGRLICLVRPSNSHSAWERLRNRFSHLEPEQVARFRELAGRHLEVIPADIGEPGLGLEPGCQERLATEVDAICHCAAEVNHRLPYRHLYRPNVIGTAEIIHLAITTRLKSVDFISSIGVASLPRRPGGSIPVEGGYARGYFASKWACEQLLRSTHDCTGVPVRVIRPSLILPDRVLAGEMNPDDLLSRLLYSILVTGIAPGCFGEESQNSGRSGFSVQGLPVDQLAQTILALGEARTEGFHVLNLNADSGSGVPLDAILQDIAAKGIRLRRVEGYDLWLDAITTRLRRLPAEQRARSLLDVAEAYAGSAGQTTQSSGEMQAGSSSCPEEITSLQPDFSRAYRRKIVDDLARWGLIEPPGPVDQ